MHAAVALRVLQVTGDDSSSAKQVVQLISSDPALTARILQLIRRADAGIRGDLTSVDRAVILLGFITQYAPWWPITRVLFMYHMFGGLVFMVLALAFVLAHFASKLRPPDHNLLVAAHLAVAVLFFGYFYPVWTAVPLSNSAWAIGAGTPPWGPKLWFDHCPNPPPPPSQPDLFCWN